MTALGTRVPDVGTDADHHSRAEDARLLRGQGRFVDNVNRPGQLWMHVVRSSFAHATISVDCSRALAQSGVKAAFGADHFDRVPVVPLRIGQGVPPLDAYLQPVLASGRVRYVGEPVAVVVADNPYAAEDAAELVQVTYEALTPVLDAKSSSASDAEPLFPGEPNRAAHISKGYGDVDAAFAAADHIIDLDLEVGRHSAAPLETRGLVADYDTFADRLTVWGLTKVAHFNREALARLLELPLERIAVRSVDAGGAFGVRGEFYPEDFLVPYLSRMLRRPVKWVEDRSEHLMAANQSREQSRRVSGAFGKDGTLLGVRDEVWLDQGAYVRTVGIVVADVTLAMLPGPYRLPAYQGEVHQTLTNKTPAGTFRAPGRFESTFACERLMDAAAQTLAIDPIEVRRRNLLNDTDLPVRRPLTILGHELHIEEGDPAGLLEDALERSDIHAWQVEAALERGMGRLVGVGVACFLEKGGGGGFETVSVGIDSRGQVVVGSGSASLGQGTETLLADIVSAELAVDISEIDVRQSDTDLVATGVGSWASRSALYTGNAARAAASRLRDRVLTVAAEMFGVEVTQIELRDGMVVVASDLGRSASMADVVAFHRAANPGEPAASAFTEIYTERTVGMTYPYGVLLLQVEVHPGTGQISVRRAFVASEVGRAMRPDLVRGQLVGGLMQGIGGAIYERFVYDEMGEPLSTSFMTYRLPTAHEMPQSVDVLISEKYPSLGNGLGLRACGESGINAAGAAVAAAVDDALGSCVVRALPLDPESVVDLLTARPG